jgi:hypothetical protein
MKGRRRANNETIRSLGFSDPVNVAHRFETLAAHKDIVEQVLDAEVRLGQLFAEMEKSHGCDHRSENFQCSTDGTLKYTLNLVAPMQPSSKLSEL